MQITRAKTRPRRRDGARGRLAIRMRDAQTALWLTRRLWRPVAYEIFLERSWRPRRRSHFRPVTASRPRRR